TLSVEAVQMIGLLPHETTLSHGDWLTHAHPEGREVYNETLERYRKQPGQAVRVEFRAQGQSENQGGPWRWLELRATIVCEQDEPSDCLGLISDITQRKEVEFAQPSAIDPLTGLGNRVALMQALDGLAGASSPVLLALLDV